VFRCLSNDDVASLESLSARNRAERPWLPFVFTSNGAWVCMTGLDVLGSIARLATVEGVGHNRAYTFVDTTAAVFGTTEPVSPLGLDAVDGAFLSLACCGCGEARASFSAVVHVCDDGARPGCGSGTAGLAAFTVVVVARHNAINCASLDFACSNHHVSFAYEATVLDGNNHRLGALLSANATRLGALSPHRPVGKFAVNRTVEGVACGPRNVARTFLTTVGSHGYNRAAALLGAGGTSSRASRPASPARKLAVNGARLKITGTLLLHGAFVTTVFSRDVDSVATRLFTSATRPRASLPRVPGVHAVDTARVRVAVLNCG